jgi:hypothetical protein
MSVNKDIIIRVGLGLFLLVLFIKVIGPVVFEILKRKIPGPYNPDNDIDSMIRRQKERLRAQYGITSRQELPSPNMETASTSILVTKEIQALYKESRWGGGEFAKDIQALITKNYSYTLAETKVNAFILLAEKRHYLRNLSEANQQSPEAIKNYLSLVMLFLILIEDIRNKDMTMIERVAKKCHIEKMELLLALQLKILFTISQKKPVKEERLFESVPVLHQYSEDTIKEAVDSILKKEANFWAKGHSIFFEELSLYLSYADILTPYPALQNKKDLNTAYLILNASPQSDFDEIKKTYKKLAMTKHPDKIGHMNLPKILEKKAVQKFNQIQAAFDIIAAERKK